MNKQWIYRNGDKPFSVTEIELPDDDTVLLSVSKIGVIRNHFSNGNEIFSEDNQHYLIPYEPYADFKINDEVYGRDGEHDDSEGGHFAGLNSEGKPTTFHCGGTSFTRHSLQVDTWNFCEKIYHPTPTIEPIKIIHNRRSMDQ
ncbi:MAG: hypothetical protein ACJAVY_001330 [Marinoscillum sp.]|jgi:hypothetical protein